MSEEITITYEPFIIGNLKNTRKWKVIVNELFGMIIMAYITGKVTINRENGDLIDTYQAPLLPYITGASNYKYQTTFDNMTIGYDSNQFIEGAVKICILLGISPSTIISDIAPDYYFGVMKIPNFTSESDGTVVDSKHLKYVTTKEITSSIKVIFKDSFPSENVGVKIPCNLYFISTNSDFTETIALIGVSKDIPKEVGEYPGTYYIFDVCARSDHRGKGLAKSLMIFMINHLISEGYSQFILQVKTDNIVAYNLYTDLGFKKVKTISDVRGEHDLLLLNIL